MNLKFGRNIFGLGAIAFGLITLFWHQIDAFGSLTHPLFLIYFVGAVELIAGLAVQWHRTMRFGTLAVTAVFFVFTIYLVPPIIKAPLAYTNWGNFFEELSIVLGGVILFASSANNISLREAKIIRAAYRCFGICVISYALYQLFYLSYTANLVPTWIPFGQMFWAVATTAAFALAAYAIISGRSALLASRLLAAMFISFCFLVWLPLSVSDPFEISNWVRNAETLIVAGSVWIVADFLSQQKINSLSWSITKASPKREENQSNESLSADELTLR